MERHKIYVVAIFAITATLGAILNQNVGNRRLLLQSSDDTNPSLRKYTGGRMQSTGESEVTPDMLLKAAHDLEKAGAIDTISPFFA